jgi:hypothetical protein
LVFCTAASELFIKTTRATRNHWPGHEDPGRSCPTRGSRNLRFGGGISVHDHIIVGRDGHASLKGLRLI